MQRAVRLTLISPMYYYPVSHTLESALKKAFKEDTGYDTVICYSYHLKDERIEISPLISGERKGYTPEEKAQIENGIALERKDGEDVDIPAGSYLFEQLPFIPEEKDLPRIILPYLTKDKGLFYARIYKENTLECVMQLLFPANAFVVILNLCRLRN